MKIIFFLTASFLFLISCSKEENKKENTAEFALKSYIEKEDTTYKWEFIEKFDFEGLSAYDILLTSQTWREEYTWTHQLTILVPEELTYSNSLLYITGGSVNDGMPNWKRNDEEARNFAKLASDNNALVAILRQIPNQPLYGGLKEDELIAYTLFNFKEDGDYTWPLLLPMVKSAVRAMDAIQEFSTEYLENETNRFTVCGASKRGWTTWLTAASDPRVEAIGSMVFDVLNMPVNLDYHLEAWNEYSIQIAIYTQLEIPQSVSTPSGIAIAKMVDPYSYREKLTMPKMIFIGTNDEYWPVDAVKHYIEEIPGENYIHYVPNAGHDLGGGEQVLRALNAFWGITLEKQSYPKCDYSISSDNGSATLTVSFSKDELLNAYFWSADSDDRDFRDEEWTSITIDPEDKESVSYSIPFPSEGFKAFYMDLEYKNPRVEKYTTSTRMYVVNSSGVI